MGTIFSLLKTWKVEDASLEAISEIDVDATE
jgi:hypothetical protein